jgi:hypothetical protein
MTKRTGPAHVVVDGSNIATEGRSMPSLAQLNEAVLAFVEEHPGVNITVVVDATFGHRIPKSEVDEFDAAVANNELVAPPAGAVGRGDAFVLSIARKANATILSNDSFQEFHGDNPWLFDDGRLIGGKPVPHVGWVFVPRLPVRGAISRKAVRESKKGPRGDAEASAAPARRSRRGSSEAAAAPVAKKASREASLPMPVPTAPPPGRAVATDAVNELMPFLEFVERHPVGTSVNAIVDSYSSHGAYVRIGDVRGYVPLRLMGEPPPRAARDVLRVGDAITLVVSSFAPARRSIDLAVPHAGLHIDDAPTAQVIADAVGEAAVAQGGAVQAPVRRSRRKAQAEPVAPAEPAAPVAAEAPIDAPTAEPTKARSRRTKKAAAPEAPAPAPIAVEPAPAPAPRKRAAKKAAATDAAASAPEVAPAKPARAKRAAKAAPAAPEPAPDPAPAARPTRARRTKKAAEGS